MANSERKVYGVLAEFAGTGELLRAADKVREQGFTHWDVHSPFPIHGMDKAMGLGRSPVGFLVGIFATFGLTAFALFLYYINVLDYPIVISSKPYFSYQAFVPPMFAITILSAALTALFGMLALNKLPRLFHPLFNSKEFEKFSTGGFFISIEATDPKFSYDATGKFLESIGSVGVVIVRGDE